MKMRHKETGLFIAMDPERIKQGHDHPWHLVEGEENGTIDPGWVGDDYTMTMLAVLPKGAYEVVASRKEATHAR